MPDNTIEKIKDAVAEHWIDLLAQPNVIVAAAVSSIEKISDIMSHCILYLKQRDCYVLETLIAFHRAIFSRNGNSKNLAADGN